jgi:dsRNA-specific ribonuclease
MQARVLELINRVASPDDQQDFPLELQRAEEICGYKFKNRLLAVEALTHASWQHNGFGTVSYERLEFIGDAVLDMIVTDYLYQAQQHYSPGHIFLRKAAMVNASLLAYICLKASISVNADMPKPDQVGKIIVGKDVQVHYLWQCLLFSDTKIFSDQLSAFTRFQRQERELANALAVGDIFPWAALTSLQAPKFMSDMIESVLGAVFIDSAGSIDTVIKVMRHLGLYQIMERLVLDNVDPQHPVSRLSMYTSRTQKKLEFKFQRTAGNVTCSVWIAEEELEEARTTELYTGRASQEGVKFSAAEAAVRHLRLRNGSGIKHKAYF